MKKPRKIDEPRTTKEENNSVVELAPAPNALIQPKNQVPRIQRYWNRRGSEGRHAINGAGDESQSHVALASGLPSTLHACMLQMLQLLHMIFLAAYSLVKS
jgi:hypothetical protein